MSRAMSSTRASGLVVAINKWDLVEEKDDKTFDEYAARLRAEAPFLGSRPSCRSARRPASVSGGPSMPRSRSRAAAPAHPDRPRSTGSSSDAVDRQPPPPVQGQPAARSTTRPRPPSSRRRSCCSRAAADAVHFSYRRFLENRLRDAFGFGGRADAPRRSASARAWTSSRGAGRAGSGQRRSARRCAASDGRPEGPPVADRRRERPADARGRRAPARGARRSRPAGSRRGPVTLLARTRSTPTASRARRENAAHLPGVHAPGRGRGHGGPGGARTRRIGLVVMAVPAARDARRPRCASRRRIAAEAVVAVGRQGHRARTAAADERGHRERRRRPTGASPRCRAPTWRRRSPAGCPRRRSSARRDDPISEARRRGARRARPSGSIATATSLASSSPGRSRTSSPSWPARWTRSGSGTTRRPRSPRAVSRRSRASASRWAQPADVRRAGGHRRHPGDVLLAAVAEPSPRAEVAAGGRWREVERACRVSRRAPTPSPRPLALAERHGVDLPIAREVHAVLYEGKDVRLACATSWPASRRTSSPDSGLPRTPDRAERALW